MKTCQEIQRIMALLRNTLPDAATLMKYGCVNQTGNPDHYNHFINRPGPGL
jgi:hypothetical protein